MAVSEANDYDEEPWVINQTVASWISVLGVAFALVAIIQERIQRVRSRGSGSISADPAKMGYFYVNHPSVIYTLFGKCTATPRFTTIRGLIEAGDMGLWTSAAIDQMRVWHGEVCWVSLYRSIFQMAAQSSPDPKTTAQRDYTPLVSEYLRRAEVHVQEQRENYAAEKRDWEAKKQLINTEIDTQDGHSLVLEQLRQDLLDLGQNFPAPPRAELYECATEYAPTISTQLFLRSFPCVSAFSSSIIATLGRIRRNGPVEKGPEVGIGDVTFDAVDVRPKLVCCIRDLETPRRVQFSSPAAVFRPQVHPTQSSASVACHRGKAIRTISTDTTHSVASSGSPQVQLNEMGRQFYKWLGSSSLTIKTAERLGRRSDSNLQSEDEPFQRLDCGLNDTRSAWVLDHKPCIEVSREELAALGLVLGMQLKINEFTNTISGFGAFGTSLYASQSGGYWKLVCFHGCRTPSHRNSQGSGYTTLMAKHMACGSLPFAQSVAWVRSIYITLEVLVAIKEGRNIQDSEEFGGSSLEYLRRLPGSKQIDAFYGTSRKRVDLVAIRRGLGQREAKKKVSSGSLVFEVSNVNDSVTGLSMGNHEKLDGNIILGAILHADGRPIGSNCTWPRAVAGIAFGGLVPQAAALLADAVSFTVAGTFGGCLNALEELVNKLHHFDTESQAFGPYVARRVAARYGVENIDYAVPIRGVPRDAAAIFGRYMNLLERITARCDFPVNICGASPMEAVYEASCTLISETYLAALLKDGPRYAEDLGLAVRNVTAGLQKHSLLSAADCAVVVRCILAAWSAQVPYIDLEENLNRRDTELHCCQANRLATLEDLPAVSALG